MIEVTRIENECGETAGFRIFGHARYAKFGKDIVCAAVSALALNTINSIHEFTEDKYSCKQDEKQGLIEFIIVSDISKESALLLNALFLGLKGIEQNYGKRFITVTA